MSTTTHPLFFQLRFSLPIVDSDDPTSPGIDFAAAADLAIKAIMFDPRVAPFVAPGEKPQLHLAYFDNDKERAFSAHLNSEDPEVGDDD